METTQISAQWTGEKLNFVGTDTKGNKILMGGEAGISPSQMIILSLAGCMGMDIVSILQKKRQTVVALSVEVTAHQPKEYPRPVHTAELAFTIKGDVTSKAVERAIALSMDTYCIVGQTLQNEVKLIPTFTIEEG